MSDYISREAFDKEIMRRYCENCEMRKGKKNGKIQFVYEFGDAPCRACDIADVMCALEDFPAADVVERASGIIGEIPAADVRPVVLCKDCKHRFMTPNGWHCHYAEWGIEDDDFCSCGEKMEEVHDS